MVHGLKEMTDAGIRAVLLDEFFSIIISSTYVEMPDTSGELRRTEGDNIFDQGSRAPVAITILVCNPERKNQRCESVTAIR